MILAYYQLKRKGGSRDFRSLFRKFHSLFVIPSLWHPDPVFCPHVFPLWTLVGECKADLILTVFFHSLLALMSKLSWGWPTTTTNFPNLFDDLCSQGECSKLLVWNKAWQFHLILRWGCKPVSKLPATKRKLGKMYSKDVARQSPTDQGPRGVQLLRCHCQDLNLPDIEQGVP